MKNISDESKNKLKSALKEYRAAKKEYGWQATLTPRQLFILSFLEGVSALLVLIAVIAVVGGILFLIFNYGIVNFLWICLKLVLYSPLIIFAIPMHILDFLGLFL